VRADHSTKPGAQPRISCQRRGADKGCICSEISDQDEPDSAAAVSVWIVWPYPMREADEVSEAIWNIRRGVATDAEVRREEIRQASSPRGIGRTPRSSIRRGAQRIRTTARAAAAGMKKRRIVAEDELTFTTVVEIPGRDRFGKINLVALGAFGLDAIERFWHRHAPRGAATPAHQSFGWYAKEILSRIRQVRRNLTHKSPDRLVLGAAVDSALQAGWLHGTAFWRFNLGDQARLSVSVWTTNRVAARKPRTRYRNPYDWEIIEVATRLRETFEYSRSAFSTMWLAQTIAWQLEGSARAIRRRLDALRIQ
jgi:hypothetical protein